MHLDLRDCYLAWVGSDHGIVISCSSARRIALAITASAAVKLQSEYVELDRTFHQAMNEVFGLDRITWETRDK